MDVVISTAPPQAAANTIQITSHHQYLASVPLSPVSVAPSPLDQFHSWFIDAQPLVSEPEAMALTTCTSDGIPSTRFVLFKQLDARGFVFYTNYTSRKSKELDSNPHAALAFYWREVHRQVRIVGRAEKVSREESEAYFKSRPIGSRLGAWASQQSKVVGEGEVSSRLDKVKTRFGAESEENVEVPTPEFWGGWRIVPDEIEFWAGRPSRLHDRVRYTRVEGSSDDAPQWKIERLAP
ncbi:pyridoxamine 5'-phosphate oxidase [Punctularia strigosozonata HHB-11173 SS5]|uniref:pyridoxamine 5'-phosphate oxidase n=1 Tax=Punctularia strigosozonata (strain HHB-11173) TaxID=741275 RepID=UPI0004416B0F|nr:pyridoxamine 5'-phosphate oxidase [Punctularia strigosozonata HHB-11173 SS5]EIN12961.1 pyridoxamine 5'-phosphate oxidase [Punctularia strigosozonata HHB-11173 SS5]